MHFLFYFTSLLLTALFLCAPENAHAADAGLFFRDSGRDSRQMAGNELDDELEAQTRGDLPWRVTADNMASLDDGIILEASGNVVLQRGDDYLKADFARYFTATDWVFIKGNVTVRLGRDELNASEAEFDLSSNTGWLKNGTIFMAGPHIYFTGENIIKHWGDRYTFQNAKVTACDGPVPDWSVAAQEARVEIDGYATLSHASFQIRDNTVIFAPFLLLPAKTTRQTGLLRPDLGISSLHGAFYTQPWFYAWDTSRDLTLYATWLEKTGFMPSVEYRSRTGPENKTWAALDFLYDSNPFYSDDQDPIDATDGLVRTNYTRFWARGMSEGQIAESAWYYKYNLDYVSDQNFLREFQQRMTGFEATRSATFAMFGRDFAEADRNRVTEGYAYRDWERFGLTFGGRYEQDPGLGHGNAPHSSDTTVQQLPMLTAYFFKGRLAPEFPLEFEASGSGGYMYRREGTRGLRGEIYPRASWPMDLKFFTLIPSAGLRQTAYVSDRNRATSPLQPAPSRWDSQTGTSRTIPDVDVEAFTQASRVWTLKPENSLEALPENAGRSQWTALRHVVQPRFEYTWVPNVHQENNPFYILDDRILPTNLFYVTLTNVLTVRKQTVIADTPAENSPNSADGTAASAFLRQEYQDLARLRLGMGYDVNEANRGRHVPLYPRRPVTDLMADASVNLTPWLSVWSQAYLSMYGDGITRSDEGLTLTHARWGSWSVGYSSRAKYYDYMRQVQYDNLGDIHFEESLSLLRNELRLNLSPRWQVGFLSSTDLNNGANYERRFSLTFIEQCYRLTGRFISKGNERSFQFNIELLGIND